MVIKSAKGTPPVPVEKIAHDPDSSGLASVLEEQENDHQGNDDHKEDHRKDGHNSSGNDSGNINDTIQGENINFY